MTRTAFAILAVVFGAACSSARAGELITLSTSDLPATAGMNADVWQSSDWIVSDASWIRFPGHTPVSIPHALGRAPASVIVYVSFDASGAAAAMASGDLAHIDAVTTERIVLSNNTNEDLFVRLAVQ